MRRTTPPNPPPRTAADLEQLVRAYEELAQRAIHDLRAPIRATVGFSELLATHAGPGLSADARRYLERIREGAERLRGRMDAFSDHCSVLRRVPQPADVDVASVVAAALRHVGADLEAVARDSDLEIAPDLPVVRADATLLSRALLEVLRNALKFRRPGVRARIRVHAGRAGDAWEIAVDDEGPGVPAAGLLEQAAEPFRRLHGDEYADGAGMGLATACLALRMQGGALRLEQRPPPGGLSAVLSLPASPLAGA